MFSLFSKFNKVFSMNSQIHNTRSAQSFFFLSPCRANTSTVYIQVPKFYNSLNGWMDGWMDGWREGGREGGTDGETNERTNKRLNE